jgi:hypothetical protein
MSLTISAIGLAFAMACVAAEEAGAPIGGGPGSPSQPSDISTWLTYANPQYGVSVQYPRDYKVSALNDQIQPAALSRVGFQLASLTRPTGMEPPEFAIDVFANTAGAALDSWLASSGATAQFRRPAQDAITIGGVDGIRIIEQTLVAPNTFYYVARGPYVYRFTPLGRHSEEMLKTVRFTDPR